MKRQIAIVAVVLGLVLTAGPILGTKTRPIEDVSVDEMTSETQLCIEPSDGMNMTWYVPLEFWKASLAQDKSVSPADAHTMIEALRPYNIVLCVRADINSLGTFKFHTKKQVTKALIVTYAKADGTDIPLQRVTNLSDDASMVLSVMRPILTNAMGKLGQNMHFFVYSNKDKSGKVIVDPTQQGALKISLAKTPHEAGGTGRIELPLNCLFVPRKHCGKSMHVSWNYCPFCGKKLDPVLDDDKKKSP